MRLHRLWPLALGACLILPACEQKEDGGESKAVVDASGRKGMTLLPLRRLSTEKAKGNALEKDQAFRLALTNSSRLSLGVVHCEGDNAGASLNAIERMVMDVKGKSPLERLDNLKASGTKLSTRDGTKIPDNCAVTASRLSGGGFARIVGRDLTSQDVFNEIQMLYLTFRGPYNANTRGYHTHMYSFLRETLGATEPSDAKAQKVRVIELDQIFNPCEPKESPELAKRKLSKTALFEARCDANGNYIVKEAANAGAKSAYDVAFANLVGNVRKANDAYLADLRKVNPTYAAIVQSSLDDSVSVSDLRRMIKDNLDAKAPAEPSKVERSPIISAIGDAHLAVVQSLFGVTIGQAPGSVISENAYVDIPLPDAKGAKGAKLVETAGFALDASSQWSGWTKGSDGTWTGMMTGADGSQTKYQGRSDGAGGYIVDGYRPSAVPTYNDSAGGTNNGYETVWNKAPSLSYTGYYDTAAKGYYVTNVNSQVESFQRVGTVGGQTAYQNYNIAPTSSGGEVFTPAGNSWTYNTQGAYYQPAANVQGSAGYMNPATGVYTW